ncbi:MAG: hypothetical protein AAB038_01220 [Planctomycetota bacterium]
MKKPILVIILVVAWMLIGIKIFSGGIGWLKAHDVSQVIINFFEESKTDDDIPKQFSNVVGIVGIFYKYHTLMGIIRVVMGLFILVSAFYLLRLRSWARMALEIIAWFNLVLATAGVVLFIFIWKTWFFTMSPILEEMAISPTEIFEGMPELSYMYNQLIYSSVFSVVYLSAVILMIILLRGKTVRNAVKLSPDSVNAGPV